MTTARRLITRAAQLIGVARKGEALSADEASDALETLNDLLDSWSNNNLLITSHTRESFTLTANDGVYTIGAGLDFDTTAPLHIASAFTREGTTDYPLEMITDKEYDILMQKSTSSGRPYYLNYDNNNTIRLYPVPVAAYELHLLSEKPITNLTLDTVLAFKPGWNRALRYNLAMELAPEFGVDIPQNVAVVASTSLSAIMRQVKRLRPTRKTEVLAKGNVYTGYDW